MHFPYILSSMTKSKWSFCWITALVYGPGTNICYIKKEKVGEGGEESMIYFMFFKINRYLSKYDVFLFLIKPAVKNLDFI